MSLGRDRVALFVSSFASLLAPLLAAACGSGGGDAPPPAVDAGDPSALMKPPLSCAFTCPAKPDCAEAAAAYACPALGKWTEIPHEDVCPAWDGKATTATPSACTASAPSGDAIKYTGPDPADKSVTILPDGHRIRAAGVESLFDLKDTRGGMPQSVVPVAGTAFVVVVDIGDGAHVVRVVDTAKIGAADFVTGLVKFADNETLNWNAAFVAPDLVLVATDDGVVQALKIDTKTGALTRDDARNIKLPQSINDVGEADHNYVGGLAVSPDGSRVVVSSIFDTRARIFDLTAATYGKELGNAPLGGTTSFAAAFDSHDATGRFAYVTVASTRKVVEIDLANPAAPKVSRTFATDKNPQSIAFLDGRWMAVANDFGDTITLVDRTTGTTTPIPVDVSTSLHGIEPTALAYDPTTKRLYATLAAINAIGAWNVDTSATPPKVEPAGRIPTSWWPSDVAVLEDGSLAVSSMRGHGNGPFDSQFPVGDGDSMNGSRGGIQKIPTPSAADLTAGEAAVKANTDVGSRAGAAVVSCPNGENDFAVPPTNTQGPSKKIDHVFFIVRENKTYDALLGDMPGLEGDPALTMKKSSADMDKLWPNFRQIVREFATSDNYYTSAELSVQGHTWTTYGRSSDFMERSWAVTGYGHSAYKARVQPQGVSDVGSTDEGSLFDWLITNQIPTDVFGEAEGLPKASFPGHPAADLNYPGGFIQSMGYPDVEKSCYVAARARVACNLGKFVYMTLPNDHTAGLSPTDPSPEVMVAVNDEGTGILVDAISHSPLWQSSLIIVTEDDPANGGDHIDHHRTPIVIASPWVKRGYVSKAHIDVSSLFKIFAHVYGIPYPNAIVANASLPLDLFTSTPDFTPYEHKGRAWPLSCGVDSTLAEQSLHGSWDFAEVDEQPGLGAQVWRAMRGEQLKELTPAIKEDMARRALRRRRPDLE